MIGQGNGGRLFCFLCFPHDNGVCNSLVQNKRGKGLTQPASNRVVTAAISVGGASFQGPSKVHKQVAPAPFPHISTISCLSALLLFERGKAYFRPVGSVSCWADTLALVGRAKN